LSVDAELDTADQPDGPLAEAARIMRTDRAAALSFGVAIGLSLVVFWVVGRYQWFIRDDWAFVLTRARVQTLFGFDDALLTPQDGHLMAVPVLSYRAIDWLVGVDSYWPFLALLLLSHVGCVIATRQLCRRVGVTAWMSTLVATVLLVFGTGWENILFAVQITYNFSLLAFLLQLLLVDHDGRVDRRDIAGSAIGLVGVFSSGFGPFFILGVGVLLACRRRWGAAVVACAPQFVVWSWWWLTWGSDPAGASGDPTVRMVLRFVRDAVLQTFSGLTGSMVLAGTGAVVAAAVVVWRGIDTRQRTMLFALWVTTSAMFFGIGLQRSDVFAGIASRYAYMAAFLLAVPMALAFDQAGRFAPWARWVPRVVLVMAIGRNAVLLSDRGRDWSARSDAERITLELVAGTDVPSTVDPALILLDFSPDVRLADVLVLVDEGAIEPRRPTTDEERRRVADVLGLSPADVQGR